MGNNSKSNNLEVKYGLPEEIVYCKRCVYSNQRPSSTVEYKSKKKQKKSTLLFDDNGVCKYDARNGQTYIPNDFSIIGPWHKDQQRATHRSEGCL